jgi:hypothetical protein
VSAERETLEAGGSEQPEPAGPPFALVRIGSLHELHRDTAALIRG